MSCSWTRKMYVVPSLKSRILRPFPWILKRVFLVLMWCFHHQHDLWRVTTTVWACFHDRDFQQEWLRRDHMFSTRIIDIYIYMTCFERWPSGPMQHLCFVERRDNVKFNVAPSGQHGTVCRENLILSMKQVEIPTDGNGALYIYIYIDR